MKKKIIILYTANYCKKIELFWGVKYLLEKGLNVEYYNLSEIMLKEKYPYLNAPKGLYERDIMSLDELEDVFKKNTDALYLTVIGICYNTYHILRLVSKYNLEVLTGTMGLIPYSSINPSKKSGICKRIIIDLKKFRWNDIITSLIAVYRKIVSRSFVFKPAAYYLSSCNYAVSFYKIGAKTRILRGSTADYLILKEALQQDCYNERHIVFIDQNIPYHPENGTLIADVCTDPDGYFTRMNRLFDQLEIQYSCDVIICAHPTSVCYKEFNYFNGRKIVYSETAKYVQNAVGVVTHNSTALSYAVLSKIPILLVTTDDIETNMTYGANIIKNFHVLLGCNMINIDHDSNISFESIDETKYRSYIKNFLSSNPQKSNGEVVMDLINSIS